MNDFLTSFTTNLTLSIIYELQQHTPIFWHLHSLIFYDQYFPVQSLSIEQIINKRFNMGDQNWCGYCQCFDFELDTFFQNQKWQLLFLTTWPALNLSQSVRATISADPQDVRINIGLQQLLWKKKVRPCTQKIQKKAYYCTDCSRLNTPIFYCQNCFMQSTHSQKCKDTGFILLPAQLDKRLRCHCGERTLTKIKHSCPQHRAVSLSQQQRDHIKQKLTSHIGDCFCLYLEMLAYPVYNSASVDQKNKFCLQYIGQLFSDLLYFGEEQEFVLQALTESFSNQIKHTIEQNKASKFPILYILFKQQLNIEIFMEVLTILLQLKDQHWLFNTVEKLVTDLIQNYSEQMQNQKQCVKKNQIQYTEKIIKLLIDKSHNYTVFAHLLTENIVPNSKHAFNKTKRYAVMRYISYLCYCISEANISLILWKDCLQTLDKNKYIFLDIIYGQYFPHFMICATAHSVIFNNLISEMENQVRKNKKQLKDIWQRINAICKALLFVSERKSQLIKKYINKVNASNLLKIIVETEASQKIKCTYFQNQRNWCYQVRKILEGNEQLIISDTAQKIKQIQQIQQPLQNEQERLILEREGFEEQQGNPKIEEKKQTKMKQSEKVENKKLSAMQKKKRLLKQKYSKAHEKILPDTLQRLNSTQITCHICRQPSQPHKQQLFCLANLNQQITKPYLLNIGQLSRYGVEECKHVFHVECIMKAIKMNGSLLQKCPLCKQNSNFGTLLQGEIMTQIGYVEFHQLLQNSKQLNKMKIPSILQCLAQNTIASKIQALLLPTNNANQCPKTMTHTLQQLYLKQNKESKQKIENNINGLKLVSIEDENIDQLNKADGLYLQFQQGFSRRQKKQCCKLIGDVFNIAVLADIAGMGRDGGVIARICDIFKVLVAKYLKIQEVEKIVNLLPCQIQDKINITSQPTTIVVNQNPNKCTIIQQSCCNASLIKDCILNINLPICLSQFYNNLSEVCNNYRKHLKSYAMCLTCNKVICFDCKQHSTHSSSAKMSQHIFYLVLDNGELRIVSWGKQQISKVVYNSMMMQNEGSQQNKQSKLTIVNKTVLAETIFEFIDKSRIKKNT